MSKKTRDRKNEKTRQYNREYKRKQRESPEFRAKEKEYTVSQKLRIRKLPEAVRQRIVARRAACKELRAKGFTQLEIAEELGLSIPTVRIELYDRRWPVRKDRPAARRGELRSG